MRNPPFQLFRKQQLNDMLFNNLAFIATVRHQFHFVDSLYLFVSLSLAVDVLTNQQFNNNKRRPPLFCIIFLNFIKKKKKIARINNHENQWQVLSTTSEITKISISSSHIYFVINFCVHFRRACAKQLRICLLCIINKLVSEIRQKLGR